MNNHNCHFIGATGESIYTYVDDLSNVISSRITLSCNQLINYNNTTSNNIINYIKPELNNKQDKFTPLTPSLILASSLSGQVETTTLIPSVVSGYGTTLATHTTEIAGLTSLTATHTAGIASLTTVTETQTAAIGALTTTVGAHTITLGVHTTDIDGLENDKLDKSIISHTYPYKSPMYIDNANILQIDMNNDLAYDTASGKIGLSSSFKNSKIDSSIVDTALNHVYPFGSPMYIDAFSKLQIGLSDDLDFSTSTGNVGISSTFKNSKEDTIQLGSTQYVLINNTSGKVAASSTPSAKLSYLNNVTADINQSFIDCSNFVSSTSNEISNRVTTLNSNMSNFISQVDSRVASKLDKTGLTANRVLTTDAFGNVVVSATIDTNELECLNGTTFNINTNNTNTSNWIAFLRDNKENTISVLPVSKGGTNKTNMTANRILGCGATANQYDEIQIGSGLSLSTTAPYTLSSSTLTDSRWSSVDSSNIYLTNAAGRVGIGTNNPMRSLDIYKNDNTSAQIWLHNALNQNILNSGAVISYNNNNLNFFNYGQLGYIQFNANTESGYTNMNIYPNLKNYMFSNLGIGHTNPISILHLHRIETNADTTVRFTDNSTNVASTAGFMIQKSSLHDGVIWNYENKDLYFGTNNIEYIRLKNTGAVGIGTSNPTSRLHLHISSTDSQVKLLMTDSTTTGAANRGFAIYKDTDHNGYIRNYEASKDIIFVTNSGTTVTPIAKECMRILNDGNIGVGAFPTHKFDVNGSFRATGGCALTVQNSQDGGTGRGIYLWNSTDTNWGIYMGQAGASKSLSGGTACAGAGFSAHAMRFRVFNNSTSHGIIFENNNETCLFSLRSNDGLGYFVGNVGIGTTNPAGRLELSSSTQSQARIILSGQEFYNANNTSSSGVALLCGVNRTDNRQLWVADSARLTQNTTNPVLRLTPGGIDTIATDGLTRLDMGIGGNITIKSSGNVGIGLTNPSALLHVASGTYNAGTWTYGYLNQSGAAGNYTSVISAICAVFDSAVWGKSTILATSDQRVKREIKDIDDDSGLQKILAIQPKTYKYIDNVTRSSSNVYGFISQQIREVIPEAVCLQTEIIPNIYKNCTFNSNVLSFSSNIDTNDICIGSNIKIYDWDNKESIYTVINYTSNSITINKNINNTCNLCFVYGTEVNDFHTLDKNYIYTLNVCAVQELHRIIMQQDERIKQLENIILNR